MAKRNTTSKEKNQILGKILKRTNQYYEEILRQKEKADAEAFLDEK